jgi:hypothetical protein
MSGNWVAAEVGVAMFPGTVRGSMVTRSTAVPPIEKSLCLFKRIPPEYISSKI